MVDLNNKIARPSNEENWTDAQQSAIKKEGRNILVTAGAGAGKTMVLVKRLLERIVNSSNPLDVDRLLVVTFTNAAAAEMKKRLALSLEAEINKNPRSMHLRRQLLLLNKAQISTVHSFCLDVIREYYYLIGLDPSFRLLDEGESLMLQQDLLEELLEDYYDLHELDSPFYQLVQSHSNARGDRPFQELIIKLYHFAWSHPEPERWLNEKVSAFTNLKDLGALRPWLEILKEQCQWELEKIINLLQIALEATELPGGPAPYRENLERELEMLHKVLEASFCSWEHLSCAVQKISFTPLKQCRDKGINPIIRKQVIDLRDSCKKELARMCEQFFSRPLGEQAKELVLIAPLLQTLAEIVCDFHKRYNLLKVERRVADFNDLEHYALQILRHPRSPAGCYIPSDIALAYRNRFDAVLVDEYQDINQLQETIINLVARDKPGNMFMVGDVKQSIYRFRLAAPELFRNKTLLFSQGNFPGEVIPLSHNFRSREEIINSVNYLFRQLMDEKVGEVPYDHDALLRGAAYFPSLPEKDEHLPRQEEEGNNQYQVELLLIAPNDPYQEQLNGNKDAFFEENDIAEASDPEIDEEEWEGAVLEGRMIARRIREMRGEGKGKPLLIYDKKTKAYRTPAYRDIVILMRSFKNYAPAILDELQRCGIPAYAELSTGYFAATEVEVMLSLLQIIDNPFQDIPLAAVLRSPLLGLRGEELARVRAAAPQRSFYEALKAFLKLSETRIELHPLREKLQSFVEQLFQWQEKARQEPLASLVWSILSESGYYDLVGGMPGGKQRQANLRALYDRARQYEASTFRGLSSFLRFVEQLRARGDDFGTGRPLGEQEDVVRLLTVHKSKGLEFPVVFVSGLAKHFNFGDLRKDFLLHKEFGFGPKYTNLELRVTYPTIPWLALKRLLHLELLAEELRVLYVALTRAEQKLVLVAVLNDIVGKTRTWEQQAYQQKLLLPSYYRIKARSYMDWIGPTLMRHPHAVSLRKFAHNPEMIKIFHEDPSSWKIEVINRSSLAGEEPPLAEQADADAKIIESVKNLKPVIVSGYWEKEIARRLNWSYRYHSATTSFAKVSISDLQRLQFVGLQGDDGGTPIWNMPDFNFKGRSSNYHYMVDARPDAAAQGTAYHVVMYCLDLSLPLNESGVAAQIVEMVKREQLTPQEQIMVDPRLVSAFFQGPLGQRLLAAQQVWRELPFTMALPAGQVYPNWQGAEEQVFIQGVIDCIFRETEGLVLLDYKLSETDDIDYLKERYRLQLYYYKRAIEHIWREQVREIYIYLINQKKAIKMNLS